jgi:hypothetical protein
MEFTSERATVHLSASSCHLVTREVEDAIQEGLRNTPVRSPTKGSGDAEFDIDSDRNTPSLHVRSFSAVWSYNSTVTFSQHTSAAITINENCDPGV